MNLSKTFPIFLLILLTSCYAAAQNNAEQEVRKLERAWLDAYEQRDVKAVSAIVADDFLIVFPDGSTQNKSQLIESLKKPIAIAELSMKFYTEDVRAQVSGDKVILSGRVVTEIKREGATKSKEESLYTDIYVKRNGNWQVVDSRLSNIPQKRDSDISHNAGQGRSLSKNRLVSQKFPPVVIDVDKQLRQIGIINFPLKKVAQVERYIFARPGENGRAQRLFIAQFEAILPGIKGGYTFQVTNPTRIGNYDYQTDIGFFNFAQTIAANPGAEAEKTKAFLENNGLKVDDDFLVARYARIASEEKRHELIFFYLENLRDSGLTRAALEQDASRTAETIKVFRDFAVRAAQSFKVIDGQP